MFIQHGQFSSSFDEERALRIFNASMSWRKQNNVYGINFDKNRTKNRLINIFILFFYRHFYR